jgi:hypothetical protein
MKTPKPGNSLAEKNPKLAKQWHPTQNGDLTPSDVTTGSDKKVWWICSKGHEWDAQISNRTTGRGCPECSGKKTGKDNNLAVKNPELAKQWHPTKNNELSPRCVTTGSAKRVWWICNTCNYEWKYWIKYRNNGEGTCSVCRENNKYPLRKFKNAKNFLDKIVKKNKGIIPKRDDLPQNLRNAINRYHGKYEIFLVACGYPLRKKNTGYWKDWENIEKILIPICEEFGCFPPVTFLNEINKSITSSLYSYHGGLIKTAKKLGYPRCIGYKADDGHFVYSYYEFIIDNILSSYKIPHTTHPKIILNDRRRGDFKVQNIYIEVAGYERNRKSKRHITYHKRLKEKLSLYEKHKIEIIIIYKEDFNNIKNIIKKLSPLIIKFGHSNKKIDIENAIRPVSWWSKWENIEKLLKDIIDDLGYFPTARELEQTSNSSISHYIMKYHGGFTEVKKKLGIKIKNEKKGFFSQWENVEKTFLPICKKLGYFPTANQIRNNIDGVLDCVTGLYKYWGSISSVAKKMGYPTKSQFNAKK